MHIKKQQAGTNLQRFLNWTNKNNDPLLLCFDMAGEAKYKICNMHWPERLYVNQNLITLIVCYVGVAYSELNDLCHLSCACWFLFMFAAFSVIVTLSFYTYNYCRNKCEKKHKWWNYNQRADLDKRSLFNRFSKSVFFIYFIAYLMNFSYIYIIIKHIITI